MYQVNFANTEYIRKRRKNHRENILSKMDVLIPRQRLEIRAAPVIH